MPAPVPAGPGADNQPVDSVTPTSPLPAGVEVSPPDHAPQGLAAEAGAPESGVDLEATAHHAAEVTAEAALHAQEVNADAVTHAQEITTAAAERATEVTAEAAQATPVTAASPPPLASEHGDVAATAQSSISAPGSEAATAEAEQAALEAEAGPATAAAPLDTPPAPLDASAMGPVPAPQVTEAVPPATGAPAPPDQSAALQSAEANPSTPAAAEMPTLATDGADQGTTLVAEADQKAAEAVPDHEAATEAVPVTGEEQPDPATLPAPAPLASGAVVAERYTIAALLEDTESGGDTVALYRANDNRSYEQCWSCGSAGNGPGTRYCQNCGAPIQNHPVTLAQTLAATGLPDEVEQDGAFFHVQPERRRFGAEGIGVEIGAHSAEGPHHPNEDSYWYTAHTLCANSKRQGGAVVVFADGMGGYAPGSGLISARIAAIAGTHIAAALAANQDGTLDAGALDAIMRAGIAEANHMVLDEIARTGEMGATLVIAVIHGDTCYVANVGDSRAYYVDPRGMATQITHDQSLVAQEVAHGRLDEGDIYTAVGNNIILHAIGEAEVEQVADIYTQSLEPGSYIILCSDGYWKTMRGLALPEGLFRDNATLGDAARALVDDALAHDSDDNTTVVLAGIS